MLRQASLLLKPRLPARFFFMRTQKARQVRFAVVNLPLVNHS